MTTISHDEAYTALQELVELLRPHVLPEKGPDEFTVAELAEAIGVEVNHMKLVLDRQVREGILTCREVRTQARRKATAYRRARDA